MFHNQYDLIIIHCELLPFFPYFIEKTLLWKKYAYDFDDAFFLRYKKFNNLIYFIFKNKFKKIIKRSLFVNAGSSYLYKYAYKYNCQTFLIFPITYLTFKEGITVSEEISPEVPVWTMSSGPGSKITGPPSDAGTFKK